jgi:tetratricopeptide (TPR) repeat protein
LDGIIKESFQLKQTINELLEVNNEIEFTEALTLISFYSDLNALDQAKQYYTKFIGEAEKRGDKDSLVLALEQLGDSEYKRSGQDGYKAAMDALTRAAEIRESEAIPQKDKPLC